MNACLCPAALTVPFVFASAPAPDGLDWLRGPVGLLLLCCFTAAAVTFYFIPTAIAFGRGHHNAPAILAVNLFFGGCLGVGWVIALVWALTSPPPSRTVTLINQRHRYRS